jgi:hypothetical protein
MAWPSFHREMEGKVENQVAAPAATRTPNLPRAKQQSLIEECGWKGGDSVALGARQEQRQDQQSRAAAPFPSWRNGARAVLAVKGSLRRKERALDRSGPLCTPSAMKERENLGKTNQNLLDADLLMEGHSAH